MFVSGAPCLCRGALCLRAHAGFRRCIEIEYTSRRRRLLVWGANLGLECLRCVAGRSFSWHSLFVPHAFLMISLPSGG